jgi:hypothetical protein
MASNPVSNQRGRSAGSQSVRQPLRRPHPTEELEHEHGYMSEMAEQASDYVAQGASRVREMTRDREGTVVVMALAAGVGVGLIIGAALARSQSEQRSWRNRATAEGFGRRLMERIESMIPDAVAEHFGR